jgi:hypothetical protein
MAGGAALSMTTGCTSLLGDFSTGGGIESDASPVIVDAAMKHDGSGSSSGGGSSSGSDSSMPIDAAPEASFVILPTVPGKPGTDITAGGTSSTSASYQLVGAVGESTGSNVVSTSTNYTLKGGVIVGTQ